MNPIKRHLYKLILCFGIWFIGGFAYYFLWDSAQTKKLYTDIYMPTQVIPDVALNGLNKPNIRKVAEPDNTILSSLEVRPGLNVTGSMGAQNTFNTSSSASFMSQDGNRSNSSSGGGISGINGGLAHFKSGKHSTDDGIQAGGGMVSGQNSSIFSAPRQSGQNIILVDPMSDPLEENRIPVGDGYLFLGLLAVLYAMKKKK